MIFIMPANLTPEYHAAEQDFREAVSDEQRLLALEQMLRTIPKHKGTDKMCADIKRRISKLKAAMEKKTGKKGSFSHKIPREGSGQVALVGGPNVGKSQLLKNLTHAHPQIADYPFTTVEPMPGMMEFEQVQIQLVDLPPFSTEHTESWLPEMVRAADAALFIVDLNGYPLQDVEFILECLDRVKIRLCREIDESLPRNHSQRRTLFVCNKMDKPGAMDSFDVLQEFYGDQFDMLSISALDEVSLSELKKRIFHLMHIIRIYAKEPHKPEDHSAPFTVPENSTLLDFAQVVHKDFTNLKFARLWGSSAKFDGQTINKDHVLKDGDIVELHL